MIKMVNVRYLEKVFSILCLTAAASGVHAQTFTYGPANTVTGCVAACPSSVSIPSVNEIDGTTPITEIVNLPAAGFSSSNINSVTIPDSITLISGNSFLFNNLSSVTIPENVTTIGFGAFEGNQLTSILFEGNRPAGLNAGAFVDNATLTTVNYLPGKTGWPGAAILNSSTPVIPTCLGCPTPSPSQIPSSTPATLALLAGLLGFAGYRNRRKRKSVS